MIVLFDTTLEGEDDRIELVLIHNLNSLGLMKNNCISTIGVP